MAPNTQSPSCVERYFAIATDYRQVVVTGVGYIAPESLQAALDGTLTAPPNPSPEITAFETTAGAPAWGFEVLDLPLAAELPNFKSYLDRTSALALIAGKRALQSAGLLDREKRPSEIGCAYGSMFGCLDTMGLFWNKVKATNPKFAAPLPFTHGYANSPSSLLCIEFGLRGAAATFTGERLAGLEALLFAYDQIASSSAEIILAGASESLSAAVHAHLFATGQLSAKGDWSDGTIPGEGGAMLVLESAESARARGATILAELEGLNFFPLDPKSSVAPMRVATGTRETLVFVSTPNTHSFGGWIQQFQRPDMPAIATKLYTGNLFSVSPVLSVALAALALKPVGRLLPLINPAATLDQAKFAVATGFDPGGQLGVAMLARVNDS